MQVLLTGLTAAPAPTWPDNRGYTGIAPGQGRLNHGPGPGVAFSGRTVRPMKPWVVKARSLARKTGAIRLINRLRPVGAYEQRVHQALTAALRSGDVVWDVGANVGQYSELFCRHVGPNGLVVAFEPSVESCARIRERLPDCAWLRVENVALGDADTSGRLVTGADSVENHVATEADAHNLAAVSIPVEIRRGDTVCDRLGRVPNVIKVDVEGFEEEVLLGMGELLASPSCAASWSRSTL